MDYLQYQTTYKGVSVGDTVVLNLIINGLPSILCYYWRQEC